MSLLEPYGLRPSLLHAERTCGLSRRLGMASVLFAILVVPAFAWPLVFVETHRATFALLQENGPVELATFAAFVAAGVLGLRLGLGTWRSGGSRRLGAAYLAIGALALVAAMEEVSWGQSFLDFRTPWGLYHINEQGELNVHNLPVVMDLNDHIVLLYGLAGLAGLGLARLPRFRRIAVPPVLTANFVVITVMGLLHVLVYYVTITYVFDMILAMLVEVVEMLMAVSMLLYVWLNGRMLRRERAAPAAAGAGESRPG